LSGKKQMAKSKQNKASDQHFGKKEQLAASKKLARQIELWYKRLAPKFRDIDPRDLNLIIASMLKDPEKRMEVAFIKRREDGVYLLDEKFLADLIEAIEQAELEVILINDAVSIAPEAPFLVKEVDFLVRDHPQLQKNLERFAEIFGVALTLPYAPLTSVVRAVGCPIEVDFISSSLSGQYFESVSSRTTKVAIGERTVLVASPEDKIAVQEGVRARNKTSL
jgi:hypothetical protein